MTSRAREHTNDCIRPFQPACDLHRPMEWGGGEPPVCEPHGHGGSRAEYEARKAIVAVMNGLSPEAQTRVLEGVGEDIR